MAAIEIKSTPQPRLVAIETLDLQKRHSAGMPRRGAKNGGCHRQSAVAVHLGQLKGEFEMSFKKASLVAMLAVSMASTPVLAQTATSASSSPAVTESARSGAAMDDANAVRGGFLIPLLAILAIIAGLLAAFSDGDDRPVSP